jgi:hypothetical protein
VLTYLIVKKSEYLQKLFIFFKMPLMYIQNSSQDILLIKIYGETHFSVEPFSSEVQECHIHKHEIINPTHTYKCSFNSGTDSSGNSFLSLVHQPYISRTTHSTFPLDAQW